jgi:choline dehydrogenase
MTMQADFVIVGAGSAGSALAARLSEDGKHSVIVVEHGGSDFGPFIQMPAALSYPMNMSLYDWGYRTEPEPHLNNRRLAAPRGKVIGGSSSINGMVYVRGHAGDFDHWAEQGANGWSFADVLPYFKRMETSHQGGGIGGDAAGAEPTGRCMCPRHRGQSAVQRLHRSRRQAGYGVTQDYNGSRQEGFGPDGADHPQGAALVRGRCLSQARAETQ